MRTILSFLSVLLLAIALMCAEGLAAASDSMIVGNSIPFEGITDFYYTYDASTAPPHYQRYRFYVEDGKGSIPAPSAALAAYMFHTFSPPTAL